MARLRGGGGKPSSTTKGALADEGCEKGCECDPGEEGATKLPSKWLSNYSFS